MYHEVRAELANNENLIKTYQKSYDELGRKHEDALLKSDHLSNNPNFTGKVLDKYCIMRSSTGTKWSIDSSLKSMLKEMRSTESVEMPVEPSVS